MNRRDAVKATVAASTVLPILGQRPPAPATLRLFDNEQNRAVAAIVDHIIPDTDTPGALKAGVPRYLDLLIGDGPDEQKQRFLASLKTIDEAARKAHSKGFADCTAEQQVAVLTVLSTAPGSDAGRRAFDTIKGWTSRIYYATEVGFKELNKKGVPPAPGCYYAG